MTTKACPSLTLSSNSKLVTDDTVPLNATRTYCNKDPKKLSVRTGIGSLKLVLKIEFIPTFENYSHNEKDRIRIQNFHESRIRNK